MREIIKLVSTAGTGHFYTTDKNKTTTPDKIEIFSQIDLSSKGSPYPANTMVPL